MQANVNRCHCSGKRLLSAWFAELRQRPNMVSPALLQHLGGGLLQACIAGKCQCFAVLQKPNCVSSSAAASWWLLTAGLYCRQMSIGATAVAKAAVGLVCSTEAETKHCVSSTAAASWWLLTAGLYCRQMSIGATAVAKGCCQPGLQY